MTNIRLDSNISNKQLEANRENSKKGGVKTNEGKEVIKYNAVKHGLLSNELLIERNDKNKFGDFQNGLVAELKPKTDLEYFLADRIITCAWRLKTVLKIENNIISWEKNKDDEFVLGDDKQLKRKLMMNIVENDNLERMNRYETSIERKFYRAINEYRALKNGFVS